MQEYPIPTFGTVPSLQTTVLESPEGCPDLLTKSYAPYKRFGVQVGDAGMDTFGLEEGDYAVFREQHWPNDECQIVLVAFGEEGTIRLMENIYASEPTLRVAGDKIPEITPHRNDFIVLGVLDGVIKREFARLAQPEEVFDWGC